MRYLLHEAIHGGTCHQAMELLKGDNGCKLANQVDDMGRLPMHILCGAPPASHGQDVVTSMSAKDRLKLLPLLLEQCPDSFTTKDKPGRCPIHYACNHGGFFDLVKPTAENSPKSIKIKDNDGKLPIHLSVSPIVNPSEREKKKEVVKMLVAAFPEGVAGKDNKENLPLHYAVEENQNLAVAKLLILKYPQGLQETSSDGVYPFHAIIQHASKHNDSVVSFIISVMKKHPSVISNVDIHGNLPIHIACSRDGCKPGDFAWDRLVLELAKANPAGLKTINKQGNLPIHFAASWLRYSTLKYFVEQFPGSLKEKCSRGKAPLVSLLMDNDWYAWRESGELLIESMIQLCPECLAVKDDTRGEFPIHVAAHRHPNLILPCLADKYPELLLQQDKWGNVPIDLYGGTDDWKFVRLAKACPQSLIMPGKIPFVAVLSYLQNHKLARSRAVMMQQVFKACASHLHLDDINNSKLQAVSAEKLQLEKKLKDQALAFSKEKKNLEQTLKEQATTFEKEKEKLESDFSDEKKQLEQASKEHAIAFNKEREKLESSLEVYKEIASACRQYEKTLIAKLLDPSYEVQESIEFLKNFAASLKERIDRLKAKMTPNAKRSAIQIMFQSFISNPAISKQDLVELIDSLNAELMGLEADLEEMKLKVGKIASSSCETGNYNIDDGESATVTPSFDRPSKRARVALS